MHSINAWRRRVGSPSRKSDVGGVDGRGQRRRPGVRGGAGGRGLGYADFTAALAHAALTALSKPAFTHLYPTPRDKVLVLLEMWGLADERKLAEIARLGRR